MTSPRRTGVEHQWTSGVERTDVHITQSGAGSGVGSPSHDEQHDLSSHTDRHKGADIASAATITSGTDGDYYDITGTTTITAIATRDAGDRIMFRIISSGLKLEHLTGTLNMRGKVDLNSIAGDIVEFVSEGSGEWTEINRSATGGGLNQGFEVPALQAVVETHTNASAKQEVAGQSFTVPALDVTIETHTAVAIDST